MNDIPIKVAEARQQLTDSVEAVENGSERVSLDTASGRILAQDVRATIAVPPWDNSAMDGYALRLADLPETGEMALPISQRLPAGTTPQPLQPGTAARIFTGAPIPAGANAVVMQEHCQESTGHVAINKRPPANNNIRAAGEDIAPGDVVLSAGQRLQPQDLGLAASLGIDTLEVRQPLRVAILATGDELTPPGQPLSDGHIYDSNGPLTAALLCRLGATPLPSVAVADTFDATREALSAAAADADLVLTSGGVSVGDEDHVKAAVQALGTLDLWKIAVKPGKPLAFGHIGDTPLIGLPGNPVSLFVTFLLFAAPVIRRMQGRSTLFPDPVPVPADFTRERPGKREEYLRVRVEAGRLSAYPQQGSGVLSSAAWADGLARLPVNATITPGDPLDYYPMSCLLD